MAILDDLLKLSHEIGREDRGLALLGEGNTSAKTAGGTFLVKASGACLSTLRSEEVVECRLAEVAALTGRDALGDAEIDAALMASRVNQNSAKPSVEAIFHAALLSLPQVNFVGHSHATSVNQILCSPQARAFAEHRMFPDEVVYCGVASVFIPRTDPGLELAKAIGREVESYQRRYQRLPRVVLLENHGIISLGPSWPSVLAAMLMAEKAAKVFIGAVALGGPNFLTESEILRIAGRPDELYRQRRLDA